MNVVSINKNHQKSVIAHEFGHSFANLAEEYTPATLPLKSKNCVSECNKFDSLNEGCYEGCSKTDYFRSINSGIMRTLSSKSYGAFNSFLISEKISKFKRITGNVVSENDFNSCSMLMLDEDFEASLEKGDLSKKLKRRFEENKESYFIDMIINKVLPDIPEDKDAIFVELLNSKKVFLFNKLYLQLETKVGLGISFDLYKDIIYNFKK